MMLGFRFRTREPTPPPPEEDASLFNRAAQQLQSYTEQTLQQLPIQSVRGVIDDFYSFIEQGNVINLAVGLILGASFTAILNSFVVDILTPVISLFTERSLANHYVVARCPVVAPECSSTTWETWKQARDAGAVTINYGLFLENVVNFFINALFLFFAVKKVLEIVFKRNVLVKKTCPYCKEFVKGAATRCKNCGSDI